MKKKPILVTGATRGLGLTIVKELLAEGFQVIGTGRQRSTPFAELQSEVGESLLVFRSLELSDIKSLHPFVTEIRKSFGGLYGLVNNGAIARDGVLATLHEQDVIATVAVNVTGTILLTKYALRAMFAQREGRVVNISSIVSHTGYNGLSVYAATKSALIGFTRSLAREVGKAGITVNAVAPGYMETDMSAGLGDEQLASIRRRSPIGRLAEPLDVARAVAFLLSEKADGITGTTVTVDAGTTA